MREMKDSGVEWIGEIPQEWEVKKLSYLFAEIGSGTTPSSTNSIYYDGDIDWVNTGDLNDGFLFESSKKITQDAISDYSTLKIYDENALIIAMYGATIGKTAITKMKCTVNQACCVLAKTINADIRYIHFWFLQNKNNIISLSYGGGQPNISQDTIRTLKIQVPPFEVQQAIADYLDKKCADIDSVITSKQEQNKLLKEQRQSIIYEAVTKGLDKNAPMKDSGVEWIGEIPQGWKLEKLKYHAQLNPSVDISGFNDEDDVSFVPMENLKQGYHSTSTVPFSKVKNGYTIFNNDDILIAKVTPCFENGNIAIASELIKGVGFGSTEINVIRCFGINTKYLFYYFQNLKFIERGMSDMYGVAGLKRLIPSYINDSFYPIPPETEQQNIVEYLDTKCVELDRLIQANITTMSELKEYRQSVIYEAVTGKKDVTTRRLI